MFEVRIHGRGGQGVVTAAELLSVAGFDEGHHAQAFPSFGSERTGAPIQAFCRIADRPIRAHEPIAQPDVLIVQDATLLHQVDLFSGLAAAGHVVLNTSRTAEELGVHELEARIHTVPASEIARRHLGRPLPGTALLGALAAVTAAVSRESLDAAIAERFSGKLAAGNTAAADAGWAHIAGGVHAPAA